MRYEESVIDGVLCHRAFSDAEWIPLSPEQLTTLLFASRAALRDAQRSWVAALEAYHANAKTLERLSRMLDDAIKLAGGVELRLPPDPDTILPQSFWNSILRKDKE